MPPDRLHGRPVSALLLAPALLSVLFSALLASCSSDPSPGAAPGRSVTFLVENATGATLFLDEGGVWRLEREGEVLRAEEPCDVCPCGPCSSCPVCGTPAPRVVPLEPGARLETLWDGRLWERVRDACGKGIACKRAAPAPSGPLTFVVRHARAHRPAGEGERAGFLDGPVGETRETFRHPPPAPVIVVVRETPGG